jgi:hypothetical protein
VPLYPHRLHQEYLRLKLIYCNAVAVILARPDLKTQFRSRLLDSDPGNFYGTRLELTIAARLIKVKLPFNMPDPPDFQITTNRDAVGLECASLHFVAPQKEMPKIWRKLEGCIAEKAAKPYCNLNTALVVDVTNIHAHGSDAAHLFDTPTSMKDFIAHVQGSGQKRFGSIVTVTWNYLPDLHKLTSGYVRHDEVNANSDLVALLDLVFPYGDRNYVLENATVPYRT